MGRNPKYQTVDELKILIDEYFKEMETPICKDGVPLLNKDGFPVYPHITVTGLGLKIGLARQQLIAYAKKDEFYDLISEAKQRCENYAEQRAFEGNATGPIFILKNHGWTDKTTIAGDPNEPLQHSVTHGLSAETTKNIQPIIEWIASFSSGDTTGKGEVASEE